MDKKEQLRQRTVNFLAWFGIACLVMCVIRLSQLDHFNPLQDSTAKIALIIGLISYALSRIMRRVLA